MSTNKISKILDALNASILKRTVTITSLYVYLIFLVLLRQSSPESVFHMGKMTLTSCGETEVRNFESRQSMFDWENLRNVAKFTPAASWSLR